MFKLFLEEFGFEKSDKEFEGVPAYRKVVSGNYGGMEGDAEREYWMVSCTKNVLDMGYVSSFFDGDKFPIPELYIIMSTHKSTKPSKTLSCHTSGNWGKAELGGNDRELCISPAFALNKAIRGLQKKVKHAIEGGMKGLNEYTVCFEVTHHRPSQMNAPVVWLEVGGSEIEWNDLSACRVICKTALELDNKDVVKDNGEKILPAVGFGGPHYAPNFSKEYVQGKVALGHICPKYCLDEISEEMVIQAFEKTLPKPNLAIIDWKGTDANQRAKLISIFEKHGIEWKKVNALKNNS